MKNTISWNKTSTPQELIELITILSEEYPIVENGSTGIYVRFERQATGLDIESYSNKTTIKYSSISSAARGIGKLLSTETPQNTKLSEELSFNTFGMLFDCSRNATIKVTFLKKYLRQMALMGYNMAMLYTKDAYELPDEPFFGYLRGRYTLKDLQSIDAYAEKLGIEMIGSVQALGHLEPTLQWPTYWQVKDTSSVILTSEKKSYELLEKIISFWSEAFKSRRLHLGMDETHDLGRGRFMDINGYKRGYDIFNNHLKKISTICSDFKIKPIIWSDMYFRMGSINGAYYDKSLVIPEDIKDDIPASVQLNYWDYYHENEEFYVDWITRHRNDLGFTPIMASGIWSWALFWQDFETTIATAVPCMNACIKENIKDFFFTVWGDDGAFCNMESVLAGAALMAEKAFSKNSELNESNAKKLFETVCRSDYNAHRAMSKLSYRNLNSPFEEICARSILWDDPLLQIYRKNQITKNSLWNAKTIKQYKKIAEQIAGIPKSDAAEFEYGKVLVKILIQKLELMADLDIAYANKDTHAMQKIAKTTILINDDINLFLQLFRKYMYARYNPQGFELLQIRMAGQKERFKELKNRLEEFISGEIDFIPELDEKASYKVVNKHYHDLATASYFV